MRHNTKVESDIDFCFWNYFLIFHADSKGICGDLFFNYNNIIINFGTAQHPPCEWKGWEKINSHKYNKAKNGPIESNMKYHFSLSLETENQQNLHYEADRSTYVTIINALKMKDGCGICYLLAPTNNKKKQ